MRIRVLIAAIAFVCAVGEHATTARGDFVLNTTSVWNGTAPSAASDWLSASFSDAPGTSVILKLSADHLSTNHGNVEDVKDWLFNLDPALDPAKLNFSLVGTVGSFVGPTINATTNDAQKTQGSVSFDVDFGFSVGNPSNRFVQGDSITYAITYDGPGAFNSNSFAFTTSRGSFGPLYDSAHIQNTGTNGQGSGDVGSTTITSGAVPEPAAITAMAIPALTLLRRRRS